MEHYNYRGKEIIGTDHGFGNIKCRHVVFRSGVRAYDTEPPMTADALYYGGKYYMVGEEHKGFVSDKSQDEDYYILTVAALARELEFRHITECEAVLAVGLPIQWIGNQKESFRKYLMRNEMIEFRYHNQYYLVRVDDVQVFPQGFAGVVQRLGDFKGLNVLADIGNGTMNTMLIKDGKPMLSHCYTDKLGVELYICSAPCPAVLLSLQISELRFFHGSINNVQCMSNIFFIPKKVLFNQLPAFFIIHVDRKERCKQSFIISVVFLNALKNTVGILSTRC